MQHPAPAQHGPSGQESGVTSFGQVVVAVAWNRILNLAMPFERKFIHEKRSVTFLPELLVLRYCRETVASEVTGLVLSGMED